ncbi:SEL1-like repeat protein [Denitrobaculum tricleocarpae]|uniref:SEL1-like repeat protein n=1 Tax=Denitrobaculum tricleocarpae TaxID=2591009 RepID=UPI0015D32156|nr:SEL1-like repeat protein [Denitrobaculum tricleocarpae]
MKLVEFRLLVWLLGPALLLPHSALSQTYETALDSLYAGDRVKALATWKILAARGDVRAQYRLARLYDLDSASDEKNIGRAVEWYESAAKQGLADAQNRLGELTAAGSAGTADPVRAAEYWRAAAEQGHPAGQYNLGLAHFRGEGAEEDAGLAEEWLRKSANAGYASAQFVLGQLRNEGLLLKQSQGLALAWYLRAADSGHKDAAAQVRALVAAGVEPLLLPASEPAAPPSVSAEEVKLTAQELARAEIENAALGEKLNEAEEANAKLKLEYDKTVARLEAQTDKAEANLTVLTQEAAAAAQNTARLEAAAQAASQDAARSADALSLANGEVQALKTAVKNLEAEATGSLEELELARKEIAALTAKVTENQEGTATTAQALAAAQTDIEKLTGQLEATEAAAATEVKARRSGDVEVAELKNELTAVKESLTALKAGAEADREKLSSELAVAQEVVARLEASNAALEESLRGAEDTAKTLMAELEDENAAVAQEAARVSAAAKLWEQDAASKAGELTGLREELARMDEQLTAADSKLAETEALMESLKTEHASELGRARQVLQASRQSAVSSRNDNAVLTDRITEAEERISVLTAALQSAEKAQSAETETAERPAANEIVTEVSAKEAPVVQAVQTAAVSSDANVDDPNLKRGREFLALGDIASARLFYELSMDSGNKRAATEIGKTYDPLYLRSLNVVGAPGQPEKAREWYEIAIEAGDPDAIERLKALQIWEQR